MSTQYVLTCTCGRKVPVDSNQAGLRVRCGCGDSLDVPSLRELSRNEKPVSTPIESKSARQSNWGPREATIMLGAVLLVAAASLSSYLLVTWPTPPDLSVPYDEIRRRAERMSGEQTLQLWEQFSEGLQLVYMRELDDYRDDRQSYRHRLSISAAIGVVGLLVVCAGIVGFKKRP